MEMKGRDHEVSLVEKERQHEFFDGDLKRVKITTRVRYYRNGSKKDQKFKFTFKNEDGTLVLASSNEHHVRDDYNGRVRLGQSSAMALDAAVKAIQKSSVELRVQHPFDAFQNLDYELDIDEVE